MSAYIPKFPRKINWIFKSVLHSPKLLLSEKIAPGVLTHAADSPVSKGEQIHRSQRCTAFFLCVYSIPENLHHVKLSGEWLLNSTTCRKSGLAWMVIQLLTKLLIPSWCPEHTPLARVHIHGEVKGFSHWTLQAFFFLSEKKACNEFLLFRFDAIVSPSVRCEGTQLEQRFWWKGVFSGKTPPPSLQVASVFGVKTPLTMPRSALHTANCVLTSTASSGGSSFFLRPLAGIDTFPCISFSQQWSSTAAGKTYSFRPSAIHCSVSQD